MEEYLPKYGYDISKTVAPCCHIAMSIDHDGGTCWKCILAWSASSDRTIFTVMDADSEFHHEHFSALTYQFLTAPTDTARFNTIWQASVHPCCIKS
eukprot:3959627-Amphidinium_carterae.1